MLRWILLFLAVFVTRFGYGQIYDCFPFFNELEILDIRLHELYDHVDKFVLVESVETFSGNPKPLYYQENRERYQKFSDKIIHVVLEERINTSDPWVREKFQRNQIMRGLKDCSSDDIILISDVDELVRGSAIEKIVYALYQERQSVVVCEQPMYKCYLNLRHVLDPWEGTCATTFQYLMKTCPEDIRMGRNKLFIKEREYRILYPVIPQAGWHFTYMGGFEYYVKKLESFSHQEGNIPENKTQSSMQSALEWSCKLVDIDDTFPSYVLENYDYFLEKGYIYEGPFTHRKPQRRMNVFKAKRSLKQEL